jgi:hypothetical protein
VVSSSLLEGKMKVPEINPIELTPEESALRQEMETEFFER